MAGLKAPSVFLSYSYDSGEHADRVLELADALCDGGIDVILDRYVHPAPEEGWPLWMARNFDVADFVLMVCTATYRHRVMGLEEPGEGLGVRWEGRLIYNRIAYGDPAGSRFIPILLPGSEPAHIPNPILGHSYYRFATFDLTDPGYEALYRHLTGQPATPRPDLGPIQDPCPRGRDRKPSPWPIPDRSVPKGVSSWAAGAVSRVSPDYVCTWSPRPRTYRGTGTWLPRVIREEGWQLVPPEEADAEQALLVDVLRRQVEGCDLVLLIVGDRLGPVLDIGPRGRRRPDTRRTGAEGGPAAGHPGPGARVRGVAARARP